MIIAFYLKDHGYILCDEISSTLDIPNISKGDHVLLPYLQGGDIIDKFFEVDEISHQFQQDRCIIAKTVYTVKPICQRKKK